MVTPALPSAQVEADRRLLAFKTYEEYLDSLVIPMDRCYLQSISVSRTLAELGYRSSGETLNREEFERRLAAVIAYLYPTYKPYELASMGTTPFDPIQKELALRERPNRVGILSTIIFLRHVNKTGFEVSGYIDFAERLVTEDWKPFFKGTKRLWPKQDDLGYYTWKMGKTMSKNSTNYKVVIHPAKGLLFVNRFDRKVICVDPVVEPGTNSTRLRIQSDMYEDVILYDHVVRQRI